MRAAVGAGTLRYRGARQGQLTSDDGSGQAQQHERGQRCVGHDCSARRAGPGAVLPSSAATPPTQGGGVGPRVALLGGSDSPTGWHAADSNFSPLNINFPFELK